MDYYEESLKVHYLKRGKIEIAPTIKVKSREDLAVAYTPGVAAACLEIQKDVEKSYELTRRWNTCLVVTDGSAVLGLGDIGPEAGMPVMEGKCLLFKEFGGVDAFPLCIKSKNTDVIVETIRLISGSFGGINLEDISAPRCFEIEEKLKACCDIPVFHDDQHGTAVVVLAGLMNAMKLVGKTPKEVRVVINGAGAAAIAICKLLLRAGYEAITICDRSGAVYQGRTDGMNAIKEEIAMVTNRQKERGSLKEVVTGKDIFIGVSAANVLTHEMVASMASDPIVFACANPTPEISPKEAERAGAAVVATGRSDYSNQINNVLAFPGIFRGVFDVRASEINEEMKLAAAEAIAGLVTESQLRKDYIIPDAMDFHVSNAVAKAVAKAARETGVAQGQRAERSGQ